MKNLSRTLTESQIQEACAHILELDGWRRLRTDPVSRREWGKGFGEKGMADDLFLRYFTDITAQVMWIEWKRLLPSKRGRVWPRSTQAAIHQQAWHTLERKRGALTLIAGQDFPASVDGFIDWYRASGLMRNQILTRKKG